MRPVLGHAAAASSTAAAVDAVIVVVTIEQANSMEYC